MAHTQKFQKITEEPKYFSKHGHAGVDPRSAKKGGFGKGNWGKPGDELDDLVNSGEVNPTMVKRRGSNSSANEYRFNTVQRESQSL